MFSKLFAERGLSLDRLKAFLAVAAAGSIVKAAGGDSVKQSQYSRQIKELEDFFRISLVERHGKGIRLTTSGRELARISRFFLLGLSNFQRGCLTEEQTFRMGANATFSRQFLLPIVSDAKVIQSDTRYIVETTTDVEIERRLHDLTLDFGVTTQATISRPLQLKELGKWRLQLWVPARRYKDAKSVVSALKDKSLPLVLAHKELEPCGVSFLNDHDSRLICESFIDAKAAMEAGNLSSVLPDFLGARLMPGEYFRVRVPILDSRVFHFQLAWNPRLMRLNPHAIGRKDFLCKVLANQINRR